MFSLQSCEEVINQMSTQENSDYKLREKYSRITKKHPKLKIFQEIDAVKTFVDVENAGKKRSNEKVGIRKAEIVKALNMTESMATRCVNYLVEENYLRPTQKRGPGFFFSMEKSDGSYEGAPVFGEDITKLIKEKIRELIDFTKKHTNVLDASLKHDYDRMVKNLEEDRPQVEPYNNIVQRGCWAKGYKQLVKLSWRVTANRYA